MDVPNTRALELAVERLAAEHRQLDELGWWRRWMSVTTGSALATLVGLGAYTALCSLAAVGSGYAITLVGLMVVLARRVLLDEVDQQIRRHRAAAQDCYESAARCMEE